MRASLVEISHVAHPKLDIRMFGCVLDGDTVEAIELLQKTSDEKNSRVEYIDAVVKKTMMD